MEVVDDETDALLGEGEIHEGDISKDDVEELLGQDDDEETEEEEAAATGAEGEDTIERENLKEAVEFSENKEEDEEGEDDDDDDKKKGKVRGVGSGRGYNGRGGYMRYFPPRIPPHFGHFRGRPPPPPPPFIRCMRPPPPHPLLMRDPRFMNMRAPYYNSCSRAIALARSAVQKKLKAEAKAAALSASTPTSSSSASSTSSSPSVNASTSGIKPLMSIKTSPTKVMIKSLHRPHPPAPALKPLRAPLKRPVDFSPSMEEPLPKIPTRGSQVHSNLRQIQTVDEPPPAPPAHPPSSTNRYHHSRGVVDQLKAVSLAHKPSPVLTRINIEPGPPPPIQNHCRKGSRIKISNLPASANFEKISTMTTACGDVKTINILSEDNSAIIEFMDSSSAENFYRQNNRKMMDLSILNISMF